MRKIIRVLFLPLAIFFGLSFLIQLLKHVSHPFSTCSDQMIVLNELDDRNHQRNWNSFGNNVGFCANYQTSGDEQKLATSARLTLSDRLEKYDYLWSRIYQLLVNDDAQRVNFLADSLEKIGRHQNLNQIELAELVVSFVQDIPYSYIIPESCDQFDSKGKPCVGDIPFGILSPYEFIHTQAGDCDTRSALIYNLLSALGYTPAIVISDEYAHAMLALNLPSTGDYILHNGEKYYFWETTAKGWHLGMLPPNTNNKSYWKVALANEL